MNGPAGLAGVHDHRCREDVGENATDKLGPHNLLFATYVIAVTLMILKALGIVANRPPHDADQRRLPLTR